MSSTQDSPNRTLKAKKAAGNPPSITNPGHSGPTTFFLKSEKEIAKGAERGRRMSRSTSAEDGGSMQKTPMASLTVDDSSYGVQSLEDAISASYTESTLSRTDSNITDENAAPGAEAGSITGRKRKARNPVHPKIAAAGQRIISSEHPSTYTSATGSPVSLRSSESPLRTHLRRGSATSSINLSQPLTPLKGSPHAASAVPSTPRSGSPKSFRLSDEEVSVASDTGSQAVASSSGEEEEEAEEEEEEAVPAAMPQLVMPSIAMPARRPFTERGRRMGRLRVMVVGPRGVGKTSLIQSICRVCEDVVHVDPVSAGSTQRIQEIGASTKPYPSWRSDVETSQRLRRASISEGVLERNITFVDTPGIDDGMDQDAIRQYVQDSMRRMVDMQRLSNSEIVSLLSGEGGSQIDVVLFVCDPGSPAILNKPLLADLVRWTNVIPLLGRSDGVSTEDLDALKARVQLATEPLGSLIPPLRDSKSDAAGAQKTHDCIEPLAISSALEDDSETMDASVLMSSGYLQPLVPSELAHLVHNLLEPDNIARLRHLSAKKLLLWRAEHGLSAAPPNRSQVLPHSAPSSPAITGTGSLLEEPSKVLVPHASSSYFRSVSPSTSESSGPKYTLENIAEPFRQVRLAKWAQDLRRSLDHERNRYKQMYANAPSEWASSAAEDSEKQISDPHSSLTTTQNVHSTSHPSHHRPAKGRLGGSLGVIDPRDPLGILALSQTFRRRGWFALQIAGGCGLVGACCWWVVRNWVEVQEWLGLGVERAPVSVVAVPANMEQGRGWLEEAMGQARMWEGWSREILGLGS